MRFPKATKKPNLKKRAKAKAAKKKKPAKKLGAPKKSPEGSACVTISLPASLLDQLRKRAKDEGTTPSALAAAWVRGWRK